MLARPLVLGFAGLLGLSAIVGCGGSDGVETSKAELAPTAVASVAATTGPDPAATPTPTERVVASLPADTAATGYDGPGDLVVPEPLPPGEPGSIIASEALDMVGPTGSRILYHSTSATGQDIAVSGFVALPAGDPPDGGWPLIAWAHGTTGLGDGCAPSALAETDPLALGLTGFGYAVVATDYEGLGTSGVHPYVVGLSEAHSVLDSVRAVHELALPVTDEFVAFGHSQGGHAALWTAQQQPTYAPELELIGTVAGAPPSQMGSLNDALIGSDFQGYLVMMAAGLAAAYDELALDDIFTPLALELFDVVETGCTEEIFDVFNPLDYADVAKVPDPFALPDWGAAIEAQDTNRFSVPQPLLIIHGEEDEQIPVETSAVLFDQLCAFDDRGPTLRNTYPEQTHSGVLTTFAAVPDLLEWAAARFGDLPAPDACDQQ